MRGDYIYTALLLPLLPTHTRTHIHLFAVQSIFLKFPGTKRENPIISNESWKKEIQYSLWELEMSSARIPCARPECRVARQMASIGLKY